MVGAFAAWVWSHRVGLRETASRRVVIERKLLPRLEQWQSGRDGPGFRVAFFGDSLSMAARGVGKRRRGPDLTGLLEQGWSARGAQADVLPLTHMAFRPIHLYYLLEDVLAGKPDLVVVELNLRVYSAALRYQGIEKFEPLSRRLSFRSQLAAGDILGKEDLSALDPTLHWAKERVGLLYVPEGARLRGQEWLNAASDWLTGALAIPGSSSTARSDRETALAEYGGDPSEEPMAEVGRLVLERLRDAGVPALFYVSPVDVERLERLGVSGDLDLEQGIEKLRNRIGARPEEWLDLHDRLPSSAFRDWQNHLEKDGLRVVASALVEAGSAAAKTNAKTSAKTAKTATPALKQGSETVAPSDDARPSPAASTADRPNIVLLIGDDHGFPYFGFMGSEIVRTPNLDSLARAGTVFPMMHNTASLCAPSLNTLLTGFYPVQWRHRLQALRASGRSTWRRTAIERVATLPRVLGRAGYESFQAWKFWEGTYEVAGFTKGTVDDPLVARAGGDLRFGREGIQPVLDFIDESNDRPFFVWFAPMIPHVPLDPPERFLALYREAGLSDQAQRYYASCSWFDDLVGQLVRHLESRGLRERTLIVYLSDNGWEQAPHAKLAGAKAKGTFHEQGVRSPLVFHWPGRVPAGRVDDRFVSSIDVFPTLADYGGAAMPPGRMGIDLRPSIEGGSAPKRSVLIGMHEWQSKGSAAKEISYYLRSPEWHYIWKATAGSDELYDKARDPDETRNVASEHAAVIADFRHQIDAWEREAISTLQKVRGSDAAGSQASP